MLTDAALHDAKQHLEKLVEVWRGPPGKFQKVDVVYAISLIALLMVEDRLDRARRVAEGAAGATAAKAEDDSFTASEADRRTRP